MSIENNETKTLLDTAYEILSKYSFLPLGNSSIQNIFLIVQDEYSIGRKLRIYYLKLWERLQSAEENYLNLKKKEIEIKKLERQLEKEEDELEKELILIEITRLRNSYKYVYKLFIDCMKEIADVIYAIKQLPEITLEEFEKQELEHFKNKMISQLTERTQITTLKALGFNINNRGEVIFEKESEVKELVENRLNELEVKDKYEEIKSMFKTSILKLPEKSIEELFDIKINELFLSSKNNNNE